MQHMKAVAERVKGLFPSAKRGRDEEEKQPTSPGTHAHFPDLPPAVKSFLESALRCKARPDFQCRSLIVSGESGSGKTTLVSKSIPAWFEGEDGGNVCKENLTVHRVRAPEFRLDDDSLSLAADEAPAVDEARNKRNMTAWDRLEQLVNAPQQNKETRVVYISIDEAGMTPNLVRALVSAAAQPTKYHKQFAGFKCVILGIAGSGADEIFFNSAVDVEQCNTEPGSADGHYEAFNISSDEWRLELRNYVVRNVAFAW